MRIVEWEERSDVQAGEIPRHLALIMDGNRRWAHARGIPTEEAHCHSSASLASSIAEAVWLGVENATFFALSAGNLKRSEAEVRSLVRIDEWLWTSQVQDALADAKANVRVIGSRADPRLAVSIAEVERRHCRPQSNIDVTFAVDYSFRTSVERLGGQQRDLSTAIQSGMSDIDLLIRSGGECRISDFMLWHTAFSELVFTDTLWPDFRNIHLTSAVREFQSRSRRFGL